MPTNNKRKDIPLPIDNNNNTTTKPELLAALNYLKHSAKHRRPSSLVPRVAAATPAATARQTSAVYTVKPPYTNQSIDRFEDCFRSDRLVQNGIVKRVELVIGKHGKIVMDTTDEFDNEDDRIAAVNKVQSNEKYQNARKQIQKLHTKPTINFHPNLKAAVIQSQVYGRNAMEIIGEDDNGLPEALHVLNSKRLGQVEVDPLTWEFKGVHYLDLQKGPSGMDDLLSSEDLVYITNRDYNISPGSLYYGLSALEGTIDGSDSKRIAKQEDIKEIMKSNWAPFLIMKFTNPNISTAQMQEVVNGISPGVPFGHKQDMQVDKVDLQGNLQQLTEAIDFLNRESLRELGVPAFVGGYEQITNYANSQQILLAIKEIEVEADRTWIKDIIQQQWLNRLFYRLLDIDPEAGDEPEVKLSYEFADQSFETKLDKINAGLLLFDRQLVSGEYILKLADAESEIEEYKLRQQELEQQRQQFMMQKRLQLQMMQPGQGQDGQGQGQGQGQAPQDQMQQQDANNPRPYSTTRVNEQVSTTYRKRQSAVEEKILETLDRIVKD